jgi:hypothetical protein
MFFTISAPELTSASTHPAALCRAAQCSAVLPDWSTALMFALPSINDHTCARKWGEALLVWLESGVVKRLTPLNGKSPAVLA